MPHPSLRRHAGFPHLSLLAVGLLIACQVHAQDATAAAVTAPQDAQATDAAQSDDATALDTILVTAQRAGRVSNGATNLDLAIKDTPQSISVVSAASPTPWSVARRWSADRSVWL